MPQNSHHAFEGNRRVDHQNVGQLAQSLQMLGKDRFGQISSIAHRQRGQRQKTCLIDRIVKPAQALGRVVIGRPTADKKRVIGFNVLTDAIRRQVERPLIIVRNHRSRLPSGKVKVDTIDARAGTKLGQRIWLCRAGDKDCLDPMGKKLAHRFQFKRRIAQR